MFKQERVFFNFQNMSKEVLSGRKRLLDLHRLMTLSSSYLYNAGSLQSYERTLLDEGESFVSIVEIYLKQCRLNGEVVQILDFGCGGNTFLEILMQELLDRRWEKKDIRAIGLSVGDSRDNEQKELDEKLGIEFIDRDKVSFVFQREQFNVVVSRKAFLHLDNPLQEVKRLYRSLRLGGVMYIDFSDHSPLSEILHLIVEDIKKDGIESSFQRGVLFARNNGIPMKFRNVRAQWKGGYYEYEYGQK